MNLLYLRYALEVRRAHSINRAAENLYMGQPNLSRAIKELEESIGFPIFERTPRGMIATAKGEAFLADAEKLLHEIEAFEEKHRRDARDSLLFSVSVPRAQYLSEAFMRFTAALEPDKRAELIFRETDTTHTIQSVLEGGCRLGIVRYAEEYDRDFKELFQEKGLQSEPVTEFSYRLLMSERHPLAQLEKISPEALLPYTEITYADPFVPGIPPAAIRKEELSQDVCRHVFLSDRGSQFDMLRTVPGAFLWAAPLPQSVLQNQGLVLLPCSGAERLYCDVLIRQKEYRPTALDRRFLDEAREASRRYL